MHDDPGLVTESALLNGACSIASPTEARPGPVRLPPDYDAVFGSPEEMADMIDPASELAEREGIHICRGRDLAAAILCDDQVVGALWTETCAQAFSFDVVVDRNHQKKGIGSYLGKAALAEADELQELGYVLELDVVSPAGAALCRTLGVTSSAKLRSGVPMPSDWM